MRLFSLFWPNHSLTFKQTLCNVMLCCVLLRLFLESLSFQFKYYFIDRWHFIDLISSLTGTLWNWMKVCQVNVSFSYSFALHGSVIVHWIVFKFILRVRCILTFSKRKNIISFGFLNLNTNFMLLNSILFQILSFNVSKHN